MANHDCDYDFTDARAQTHWAFLDFPDDDEIEDEELAPAEDIERLPAMFFDRFEQVRRFRMMAEQLTDLRAQLNFAVEAFRRNLTEEAMTDLCRTWPGYLFSLLVAGPLAPDQAMRVMTLWSTLQFSVGDITPPHAVPFANGTFSMAWDKERHHFELEVQPGGLYDWFYMDRLTDLIEGEQDLPIGKIPEAMAERLRQVAL